MSSSSGRRCFVGLPLPFMVTEQVWSDGVDGHCKDSIGF